MADAAFRNRHRRGGARARDLSGSRDYLLQRALQLEYDGVDSTALLERAARVNPLSSEPRIRLGLAAETRGDFAKAEPWLLMRLVLPSIRAGLDAANFYFRRERRDEFWKSMWMALEILMETVVWLSICVRGLRRTRDGEVMGRRLRPA